MTRLKRFQPLSILALSLSVGLAVLPVRAADLAPAAPRAQIQQIRNATAKITYAGKTFLLDPFLAKKGAHPGFPGTFNSTQRNPLVELPIPPAEVLRAVDAVIVTHTHLDHWDGADHAYIPKALPLFVQHEADARLIRAQGYTNVRVLAENTVFEGVRLSKVGGQHGTDEMYAKKPLAEALGQAMGVVFQAPGTSTIYVAGDTVWRRDVDQALVKYRPDVIVLNAGEARMVGYAGSIIMGKDDVLRAHQAMPKAVIVATHLDAINHMTLSRKQLQDHVSQHGIDQHVRIPADGEILKF